MRKTTLYTIIAVIAILSLLWIAGCGDDNNVTPVVPTATPVAQTITQVGGGAITAGGARVDFPANSVNTNVTGTGAVVTNVTPPAGITVVSSIYDFTLSNPGAYNANTATITIPITATTGVSVYRSTDGTNWTNIGGTVTGNNISALVPGFSFFLGGTAGTGPTATATPTTGPDAKPTITVTWGDLERIDDDTGDNIKGGVNIGGDSFENLYATWDDWRSGGSQVYFSYKPSGGTWSANERVDIDGVNAMDSSLAVDSNGNAYALWSDSRNQDQVLDSDIYFSYRPSGGTWGVNERVDDAPADLSARSSDIVVDDSGNAYAIWQDSRNGDNDVYFSYRSSGGTWSANERVDDALAGVNASLPKIGVDGSGNAYAVWQDYRNGDSDVYFSYRPSGGTWGINERVDNDPAGKKAGGLSISVEPGGNAFVAWVVDKIDGEGKVYLAHRPSQGTGSGFNSAQSMWTTYETEYGQALITALNTIRLDRGTDKPDELMVLLCALRDDGNVREVALKLGYITQDLGVIFGWADDLEARVLNGVHVRSGFTYIEYEGDGTPDEPRMSMSISTTLDVGVDGVLIDGSQKVVGGKL